LSGIREGAESDETITAAGGYGAGSGIFHRQTGTFVEKVYTEKLAELNSQTTSRNTGFCNVHAEPVHRKLE
jgi:hypothetical protein